MGYEVGIIVGVGDMIDLGVWSDIGGIIMGCGPAIAPIDGTGTTGATGGGIIAISCGKYGPNSALGGGP